MFSTLHQGKKEHSQSTNDSMWRPRSNAGGERQIAQLYMLTYSVVPKRYSDRKYSWPQMASVLQTTSRK